MGLYGLAQAGDPEALNALVHRHLPLVRALSARFSYSEDAFQQGCMGLIIAIRRYREDSGNQFSTYAVPVILGEMKKAASKALGWRAKAALNRAKEYQEQQMRELGRRPAIQEIAAHAGVAPEELALLLEWDRGPVYDASGTLLSSLPDPGGGQWLDRLCIRDVLARLPSQDSWLIRQRFVLGRSQSDLARALRVPQSSLSRREKRAKQRFRQAWLEP